jgi:hypothetical protein
MAKTAKPTPVENLLDLPWELTTEVAAWFTLPDLRIARLVCRKFLALKPVWHIVDSDTRQIQTFDLNLLSRYIDTNLVSALYLHDWMKPPSPSLPLLLACSSHLQHLWIDCPSRSDRATWHAVVGGVAATLRSLTLRVGLKKSKLPKMLPRFANLESFKLSTFYEFSSKKMCKFIEQLPEFCPNLQFLNINTRHYKMNRDIFESLGRAVDQWVCRGNVLERLTLPFSTWNDARDHAYLLQHVQSGTLEDLCFVHNQRPGEGRIIQGWLQQWECCPSELSFLLASEHSKIKISKRRADRIDVLCYVNHFATKILPSLLPALHCEGRLDRVVLRAKWTSETLGTALAIPTTELMLQATDYKRRARFEVVSNSKTVPAVLELSEWACDLTDFLLAAESLVSIRLYRCDILSFPDKQPRGRALELTRCAYEGVELPTRYFCF